MCMYRKFTLLMLVSMYVTFPLMAARLRFILENYSGANLFACVRTKDCNPLDEAEMPDGTRENLYTENFSARTNKFIFKIQTNNESRRYDIVYDPRAKILQLQRDGIVFDEAPYNVDYAEEPMTITVQKLKRGQLDVYFNPDAIYNANIAQINGFTKANSMGYKPSLYLGDGGQKILRQDKNRFCPRSSECRNDLTSLTSYVGRCDYSERHDNLNPFCGKEHTGKWRTYREKCNKCSK